MKKLLIFLILPVLIFTLGFQNRVVLAEIAENLIYHSPCDTPISYRLGNIDPRFNITREDFLADIGDASRMWNKAYGKNLFAHDPKGRLPISLVYDERQMLNTQISEIDKDLAQKKSAITPEIEEYKKRSSEFAGKVTALNQKIDYWNSHGGAPPDEYKKLIDEQKALQKEAEDLNQMAGLLNQSTGEYNSKIQELNKTVGQYNEELKYRPEEGIYISDENGRRIIIYFYISKNELIHTLAHEMGHALGMSHINTPSSIMYSRTTEVLSLSNNDFAALNEVCRKISVFETLNIKINYALNIVRQQGFQGLLNNLRRDNFINPQ